MTPRDRARTAIDRLGTDEVEVVAVVAERLAMGRHVYGELCIDDDPRDFAAETLSEAADGLVYAAVALIRHARKEGPRG